MEKSIQLQTNIRKLKKFTFVFSFFYFYACYKYYEIDPEHPVIGVVVFLSLFALMMASMFVGRFRHDLYEHPVYLICVWGGSIFMGFAGSYLVLAGPIDAINMAYALLNNYEGFLNTNANLGIFYFVGFTTAGGLVYALMGPEIVQVEIIAPENSPKGLDGLKIVQISDLHIGTTVKTRYVRTVVNRVNALNPDIIIITGDLVDFHTPAIRKHLQPLADLKSTRGTYGITGNHEYYWGLNTLFYELEEVGIIMMVNENKIIDFNGAKILLSGVPDTSGHLFEPSHLIDMAKAAHSDIPADFKVLMSHRPDTYKSAEKHGFDIQFSGHTHAGQFFPFNLIIPLAHKYYKGLHRHGKLWLYINRGTGFWGPANRFGIRSEITLATLRVR